MKNVGILTFWGVPNYGAFAQAYALNNVLNSLGGYEAYHIAWLHSRHHDLYYKNICPKIKRWTNLVNPFYYQSLLRWIFNRNNKYPLFERDWAKISHINVNDECALENLEWDIVITGSDAIWEYSIKEFGNDTHLIGEGIKCNKLISYAASFGEMNPNDNFGQFIVNGLKRYDAISVRDNTGADIVNKLVGIRPRIVLDPTFLWDFAKDSNIPTPQISKYILVYGMTFEEKLVEDLKSYAKEKELTIVGAGLAPKWCDVCLKDIAPLEWIGMFSRAEFVVTCTFHGLMFSLNYNKVVYFNQIAYTKNRSESLVQELGIKDLCGPKASLRAVLDYDWNYADINNRLNKLKDESMTFLKEALGNE